MKLQGEHLFPVDRERLWAALLDPTLLQRVLPGCEPLESTGERRWKTAMALAVGPVQGRFQGNLELSDLVAPESYRLKLDGSGPAGFLRGSGTVRLATEGSSTRLSYEVDAQVGGKVASVGQRLVESSARALARQGLEGLEAALAARAADSTTGPVSIHAASPPPSTTAFAARFARGLWSELPLSWRVAIAGLGAVLLVASVFLLRGC